MKVNIIIPQQVARTEKRGAEPSVLVSPKKQGAFGDILSSEFKKADDLKLSAHAEKRLRERNVTLNKEDMQKIEGAVQKAAAKGSKESLVIYGDLALVTSIRNKTIITAIEGKDMEDHVFTNIDSTVFVK